MEVVYARRASQTQQIWRGVQPRPKAHRLQERVCGQLAIQARRIRFGFSVPQVGMALLTRAVQRVTTTLTAHNNLNEVDPVFSFNLSVS